MTQKEIDKFLTNTKVYVNGKSKTYYKCHKPYEIACEHFEELSNK